MRYNILIKNLILKVIILGIVFFAFLHLSFFAFAVTMTNEPVPTANEVLVVYNSSYSTDSDSDGTQDSLEIASYYKNKRSIPIANVLGISTPTTEEITRTQYNTNIKTPIESYLTSSGLKNSIKYIVLIKGIPLKISATSSTQFDYGTTDNSSVDSAVCLLFETYSTVWHPTNPYYNVDPSFTKQYRFKTEHFSSNGVYLRYLVTRLDGYTISDVLGMIDRAFIADTSGAGYWVIDDHQKGYDYMQITWNTLHNLGQNLNPNPWSDTTNYITTNPLGSVIGYVSHGIHASMGDGYVSNSPANANHLDFTLLPGAVFSSYESFNAYGFVNKTQSDHGQVAEWIEIGGSGGVGNVYEPWASGIAHEEIFMPLYVVGYPWADAVYQSLAYIDFVSVVVGDPLMSIRDVTPPSEVTNLQAVAGDTQISLSWTNPVSADFAGVKIVRKVGSYPANITDGTVVYNSNGTSYVDTGLTNDVTYYYSAFTYDEVPNYSLGATGGARATATPATVVLSAQDDVISPNKPTNFTAIAGNGQINLSWTNPSNSDLSGVKILRRTNYYPISPTNGTLIYKGIGTTYTNVGLTNGTTYFYTIFAFDTANNFSVVDYTVKAKTTPYSGSSVTDASEGDVESTAFTEPNMTIQGNVADMASSSSNGQVSLTWTNPFNDVNWKGTRIVRKIGAYSTSPSDGKIIYNGTASSYTDTTASIGTTYYYTAFAFNDWRNYSDGTSSGSRTTVLAQ